MKRAIPKGKPHSFSSPSTPSLNKRELMKTEKATKPMTIMQKKMSKKK